MLGELCAALKESGATDRAAQKAAAEVAEVKRQVNDTKGEFANIRAESANVKTEFASLWGELMTTKAPLGVIAAGVVGLVVRAFVG